MKIKSRNEILNDIVRDAKKYPREWKAVFGKDKDRLSNDYYIFNPNIGIYLLKEYQKNPFDTKGIGGKVARHLEEDIEDEITRYASDFGIVQGNIRRILNNIKKGIPPQKILDAAMNGEDMGLKIPVRGQASSSEESFTNLHEVLSTKQKKLDQKLKEMMTEEGLYNSYG